MTYRFRRVQNHESERWPEYCCIILRDEAGRYLFERRPFDAAAAASQLTCFGGRREAGEKPLACIVREVSEELGITLEAAAIGRARVVLRSGERIIAWFYAASLPQKEKLRTEPGREAVWLSAEMVEREPVSPWHLAALRAEAQGHETAWVEDELT